MRRFLPVAALAAFALCLYPLTAFANSSVVISEVAWAGSGLSTADEWFEIANVGTAPVDISGWRIAGAAASNGELVVPADSVISASETFLIANYAADDAHTTLAATPQWVTASVSLPNDHLHLVLRDTSGTVVDEAGVGAASAPAGTTGTIKSSMERVDPGIVGTDPNAWQTATASTGFDSGATDLGTPGSFVLSATTTPPTDDTTPPTTDATTTAEVATVETDVVVTPVEPALTTAVRLSEFMPIPSTGDAEWIELTNPSSVGELLDGWVLEDGKGEVARLSGLIMPWGRLVVSNLAGHLNDDGDLVVLKDASDSVVDAVGYGNWPTGNYTSVTGAPKHGETVARLELSDAWAITIQSTQGAANVVVAEATPVKKVATRRKIVVSGPAPTPPPIPASAQATLAFSDAGTAPQPTPPPSAPPFTEEEVTPAPVVPPKPPSVKAGAAAKAAPKPRYKGTARQAVVAVPLGVYGKTRMIVNMAGTLRELRLSSAPQDVAVAGTHITFIAQDKNDAGTSYLSANVKTLETADEAADEPVFTATDAWPTESGPVELKATVVSTDLRKVTVRAGVSEGVISLPSATKLALKPGDEISAQGFVSPSDTTPLLFLAAADALSILKSAATAKTASNSPLPAGVAAAITAAALGVGLMAYLRNERLKRLSLVRQEGDLPMEE